MNSKTFLLINALNKTNQLLTGLLNEPTIPAGQKDLVNERLTLNEVAINIAKLQEEINA